MQAITQAAIIARADTTATADPADNTDAEAIVTGAIGAAADAVEQHVPDTSPFKPLVHSALQMAIMFAIKGIFRRR